MERTLTDGDFVRGIVGAHAVLLAAGPLSSVTDLSDPSWAPSAAERLVALAPHVTRVDGTGVYDAPAVPGLARTLSELRRAWAEDPGQPLPRGRGRRDRVDLARLATVAESASGRLLARVVADDLLPVLPEAYADEVLAERPDLGRVVEVRPGGSWASRSTVRTSGPAPYNELPGRYDAPPLSLREYAEVDCLGRQAACTGRAVLPESYRDPFRRRLVNPALTGCTPWFVRRPSPPDRRLAGSYFWLDTHVPGHFGHALTEQVAHLWGWQRAKALDPAVRALLVVPGGSIPDWTQDLLAAGGVGPDDLVVADGPVRVERLLACSPAYVIGAFAHPVLRETWGGIGTALDPSPTPAAARVFVTRGGDKRVCRNAAEVESLFVDHGFTVVRPETLSLAGQARVFRGAAVVAGFAGSGMFQTAFAARPQHVIAIAAATYPAHNETQIAALLGHRLDLVVCRPDTPRRDHDRFTEESFHSDYAVDWSAEGAWLREVLTGL